MKICKRKNVKKTQCEQTLLEVKRGMLTDCPIGEADDKLEYSVYAKALSSFVKTCDTPMTIAIQGDWGMGKSTIMKMIQENLDDGLFETVWINTWESAQLGNEENLDIIFLSEIIDYLMPEDKTGNILSIIKNTGKLLGTTTAIGFDSIVGNRAGDTIEKVVKVLLGEEKKYPSLKEIKQKFIEAIKNRGKKVVFFIDDLDRLNPEKSVELLEILKNYLDCDNCIFILAIDYSVVVQGVKAKYPNMDDKKAEKFFHKIIQVPYVIPKKNTKLKQYVTELLASCAIEVNGDDKLVKLIVGATRENPREIKRLINLIKLQKCIYGEKDSFFETNIILIVAVLGLQIYDNDLYDEITSMEFEKAKNFDYGSQEAGNEFLIDFEECISSKQNEWEKVVLASKISDQNVSLKTDKHKTYYAHIRVGEQITTLVFNARDHLYKGDRGLLALIVHLLQEQGVEDSEIINILKDNYCTVCNAEEKDKITVQLQDEEKKISFRNQELSYRKRALDGLINQEAIRGFIVDNQFLATREIISENQWIFDYLGQ